ncbi:MAG: Gfo/Idh/MocA family protein [Pseudorhodobacter sp.]
MTTRETGTTRLAVIGAGLIGREHITLIENYPETTLVAICDPAPASATFAADQGIPHFTDHEHMFNEVAMDGVIIASPNRLHAPMALSAISRGIPCLVEKPVAENLAAAASIVTASETRGVPVLVGHHRRHSPDIRAARKTIGDGTLGPLVAVNGMTLFDKPDSYFEAEWRQQPGGGPLLINLIHDLDILRHLIGEIESIRAFTSSAIRGFAVEDTASVTIRFENGVLGTYLISDAAVSPWAWEFSSGQALYFPSQPGPNLFIAGRKASLSLSDLYLWRHAEEGQNWQDPLLRDHIPPELGSAYINQLQHFIEVIDGKADPLISARDGMTTLAAILAVERAAQEDRSVTLKEMLPST